VTPLLLAVESHLHDAIPEERMSFTLYIVGFVILVAGLVMGANLLHVPPRWIGVGLVVLIGLGVLTGVTHTRRRDPAE
jgi:hypothetical protein